MIESREAVFLGFFVNLVNFVDFVRTRIWHQISLLEGEISHKVRKEYKGHKTTGDCAP
jgi:hypothetical protein